MAAGSRRAIPAAGAGPLPPPAQGLHCLPGAVFAEVVLRHSLGWRLWGPEEPLSESVAGSSGLSSTVRTDRGKEQACQSLWRLLRSSRG